MLRDGDDQKSQPEWLDYMLLSKWQSGDWVDPNREVLPAAEARQHIECDGLQIIPWDLKGDERKTAKNFFLRVHRPEFEKSVVAEAANNITPQNKNNK